MINDVTGSPVMPDNPTFDEACSFLAVRRMFVTREPFNCPNPEHGTHLLTVRSMLGLRGFDSELEVINYAKRLAPLSI